MRRRSNAKPRTPGLSSGTARRASAVPRPRRKRRSSAQVPPDHEAFTQQQRLRVVGELTMGIAHDVGNALGALSLRLQVLNANAVCRSVEEVNLRRSMELVGQMDGLLRRMSALARVDHQQAPLPTDLEQLVREAVETARSGMRLTARAVGRPVVTVECAMRQLPPVLAIEEDLNHVLLNLLMIARDAMPRGGHHPACAATTTNAGSRWWWPTRARRSPPPRWTDCSNHRSAHRAGKGSGPALDSCRRALERMGGTIAVRNRLAGGAEFEVRLRRVPGRAPPSRSDPVVGRPLPSARACPRTRPAWRTWSPRPS